MANNKVGLGIVGLSAGRGWAAGAHIPALKPLPDFEVRALVASSRESAKKAGTQHGVALCFDNVAEMAAHPEVDLVVVSVKTPNHYAAVEPALRAGKNVLCEWPLGNGLKEAEDLTALAKSKGVRTFIGLQARSAPVFRYVRALVAQGYIGKVISSNVVGAVKLFGGTVDPTALYLMDRNNGASLLTIPFGHSIDAVCWCLGEFRSLSATLANRWPQARLTDTGKMVEKTIDDQVAVTGILQNGALVSIHYQGGRSKGNFQWEIHGTKGDLAVTAGDGVAEMTELWLHGRQEGEATLKELTVPADYIAAPGAPKDYFYAVGQAYAQILKDLRDGSHLVPDFADALVRHRMLDAIQRAADSGQRQSYAIT